MPRCVPSTTLRLAVHDMADNLTVFQGKPDEFAAALEQMRRNAQNLIAHAQIVAEIKRGYYDALIAQKFTPEQALELCKGSIAI